MKVTAIGVNNAFGVGKYHDAIVLDDYKRIVDESKDVNEIKAKLAKLPRKKLYEPKWQSNFLLEFDTPGKNGKSPYRLMIDMGGDYRHALALHGLKPGDISGVYITHNHNDHIGGMECQALSTIFNPFYSPKKKEWLGDRNVMEKLCFEQREWSEPPDYAKPDLFIHEKVLSGLRKATGPGLETLQGVPNIRLETYFNIETIGKTENGYVRKFFQDGAKKWELTPIFAMHVISSSEEMASYGLKLKCVEGGDKKVLFPSDTQHCSPPQLIIHYQEADVIYMDCETGIKSGVHPHITDLIDNLDPDIQKKCYLYHYDAEPEVPQGMFAGVLKIGDQHNY